MDLDTAPTVLREPIQCDLCHESSYVLYENEKVCPECGYLAGSKEDPEPEHPWFKWRVIRNTQFEEGQNDRRKVVGSYAHAYAEDHENIHA